MNKIKIPTWSQGCATIELADLFEAYADCRTKKRNTMNALSFELDYEQEWIALWEEINIGTYTPGRSIAFLIRRKIAQTKFTLGTPQKLNVSQKEKRINPMNLAAKYL